MLRVSRAQAVAVAQLRKGEDTYNGDGWLFWLDVQRLDCGIVLVHHYMNLIRHYVRSMCLPFKHLLLLLCWFVKLLFFSKHQSNAGCGMWQVHSAFILSVFILCI